MAILNAFVVPDFTLPGAVCPLEFDGTWPGALCPRFDEKDVHAHLSLGINKARVIIVCICSSERFRKHSTFTFLCQNRTRVPSFWRFKEFCRFFLQHAWDFSSNCKLQGVSFAL